MHTRSQRLVESESEGLVVYVKSLLFIITVGIILWLALVKVLKWAATLSQA